MGNTIALLIVGGLAIAFQIQIGVAVDLGAWRASGSDILSRRVDDAGNFWWAIAMQAFVVGMIAVFLAHPR